MTTDPGDLVLDPTCGSGTTAYVAEQWGRRWITCDTSRVALALARTRMMAAKFPYYLLADSPEGIKKETELTGKMPPEYKTECDIRKGFVYERVPHVTFSSIANNPDIQEDMTREQIECCHRPPCRHRNALRPALRGQQVRAGVRAILGGKPFTASRALHGRRESGWHGQRARRPQAARLLHHDSGEPEEGGRAEHPQERTAQLRPARSVRRSVAARGRRIYRRRRQEPTCRGLHRPRAWHRRPATSEGSSQGSGAGRRL